MLDLDF